MQEAVIEQADEERWIKLEWYLLIIFRYRYSAKVRSYRWKLHLRPKGLKLSQVNSDIPQLPRDKSAVEVLGDFLKYLFQCARTYIQDTHASGKDLWNSVNNDIDFVLTHPNGWEGAQQSQIRRAAVLAGVIPDNQHGQSRVQFVTEGEASLHFCLGCGLTSDVVFYFVLVI